MTDIRVNTVLPKTQIGTSRSGQSGGGFLSSLQAVSAADIGSSVKTVNSGSVQQSLESGISQTDVKTSFSGGQKAENNRANSSTAAEKNTANSKPSTTEQSGETDGNAETDVNQQSAVLQQMQGAYGNEQTADTFEGELQEQPLEVSEAAAADSASQPMLNLDKILENIKASDDEYFWSGLAGSVNGLDYIFAAGLEAETTDVDLERIVAVPTAPEAERNYNELDVPAIDLDRILARLGATDTFATADRDDLKAPAINLDRILSEIDSSEDELGPNILYSDASDAKNLDGIAEDILSRFEEAVKNSEEPSNLDKLMEMLENAIMTAVAEMNDPDKQAEELREKIIKFLLEFVEKMNKGDEKRDKKTALEEDDNNGELGLLMQIIENMIRSNENVPEKTSVTGAKPLDAASAKSKDTAGEYFGLDVKIGIGADEAAAMLAGQTVQSPYKTQALEEAYAASFGVVEASNENNGADDNAQMMQKARKVLDAPAHDGRIRESQLPQEELEELQRLIGGKERRLDQFEENKYEDKEAEEGVKTVFESGKSLKNESVESILTGTSKADGTAVARSFELGENGVKQIFTQIVSEVLNNMPKEESTNTVVMMLNPATLGKVTVKITEQAGRISLLVTAHNRETAEILASRLEGMQEAMKDSGTQLEKCQVVYSPENDERAGDQNYDGSSKNPYVRQDQDEDGGKDGEVGSFSELIKEAV